MKKAINQYNSFVGVVNKVGEYNQSISNLPPHGDGAKKQVDKEIRELFKQLNGQAKSLESTILRVIGGANENRGTD